jgi:hypothetical protein
LSEIDSPQSSASSGPNIVAGNVTGQATSNRLFTPLTLILNNSKRIQLTALVDSGSDFSFIDLETAHKHDLILTTLGKPVLMETVDGTPLTSGSPTSAVDAQVLVKDSCHNIRLFAIRCPHAPVLLGLDWLKLGNF